MSTGNIYESPDGGHTIYARKPGETARVRVAESDHVREVRQDMAETQLWHNIRSAAKTDPVLQQALDQVRVLYELTRGH